MPASIRSLALVALLAVASGCATSAVRTADSFDREAVEEVGIMPPEIEYFVRTATLTEPRPERNDEVASVLVEALRNVLARTPIRPEALVLTDSALVADPALALELTRARESVALRADSIATLKAKTFTLAVDPEVGRFADLADTDHLLFVRGSAFGSSGGAVARDAAVAAATMILFGGLSVPSMNGLSIELVLVDANTAEVVWYNRTSRNQAGSNPLNLRSVETHIERLLAPLAPGHLRARRRAA